MRQATKSDLPHIMAMVHKFHIKENPRYSLDVADTEDTMLAMIKHGFVVVTDGGFIAGISQPLPLNKKWLVASEFLWWSEDSSGMKLIRAFRKWAKSIGANEIKYSCPDHNARVKRVFSKMGTANEVVYSEILKCV